MLPTGKILKQNLRYVLFADISLKFTEPKTKRRAFAIIEAAINCYDRKGFENVTLEMIARESGMTRPSLKHYFKDLEEIRDLSLKYIRVFVQKLGVESMGDSKKPDDMLNGYLEAHLKWTLNFKVHFRVWMNFLSSCTRVEKNRALNSKAVDVGTERLVELLERGRREGIFIHKNDFEAARVIQCTMIGWLIALATEDMKDIDFFSNAMKKQCLSVVLKDSLSEGK